MKLCMQTGIQHIGVELSRILKSLFFFGVGKLQEDQVYPLTWEHDAQLPC